MDKKTCRHEKTAARFEIPFDVKSGSDTQFGAVHECTECSLSFVNPMPAPDQIAAHYDLPAYYTHGESHLPVVDPTLIDRIVSHLVWRTDQAHPFDLSEEKALSLQGHHGLDIGCGSGVLLSKMKSAGMHTVGIDPDAMARVEAKKKGHEVFPGTAEALPTEVLTQKFNLITMTHVLEHCLDPLHALKNIRGLLSQDGIFYCEVPNAGSLYFETYGQISEMLDVPRHLFFFRKANLESLAAAAGLEITGWRYHGLTRHFGAGWKVWENRIYDRLVDAGVTPSCQRRSFLGDLKLFASGLGREAAYRYDCIGFTARRADL